MPTTAPNVALTLPLVRVEEGVICISTQDRCELPWKVRGIAYTRVNPWARNGGI